MEILKQEEITIGFVSFVLSLVALFFYGFSGFSLTGFLTTEAFPKNINLGSLIFFLMILALVFVCYFIFGYKFTGNIKSMRIFLVFAFINSLIFLIFTRENLWIKIPFSLSLVLAGFVAFRNAEAVDEIKSLNFSRVLGYGRNIAMIIVLISILGVLGFCFFNKEAISNNFEGAFIERFLPEPKELVKIPEGVDRSLVEKELEGFGTEEVKKSLEEMFPNYKNIKANFWLFAFLISWLLISIAFTVIFVPAFIVFCLIARNFVREENQE